jgi:lysophospholipase L1-like esterase
MSPPPGRYVALGDSFTEGVGDYNKHLPNGVRGWADRVAERLAKADPGWEYANLAIRSKRLRHIIAEQLAPAIGMQPTLISLYAGGNDILDAGTDLPALMGQYEDFVAALAGTGATLLLFTGYDIPLTPARQLFQRRNHQYNDAVRGIAARHGAVLVDYAGMAAFEDRRMWASDRLHMSKAGHRHLAAEVLDLLDVPHTLTPKDWEPLARRTLREWEEAQRRWAHDWVFPLVGRKMRRVTLGDHLAPRWPTPIEVPVRGGLRSLTR